MADSCNRINDISTKEFQRKLFDWFDKRGLLSELRAFMRHRMISALYSSESPCPANHLSVSTSVSPTLQALLLLVAEFLVQQEYHYTMSVMVAEAPLLASFPKFSGYVSYMSKTDSLSPRRGNNFPRYSEKDVMEILEVLGMASDSDSMEHVLRLYSNNNARESLLACVLTALSAIAQSFSNVTVNTSKRNKMADDSYNSTKWIEEIRLVLLRAQLTSRQLQQVEDLLRRLQADNAHKVRQEENEKHNKLNHIREQELLAEALVREEKFRDQIQEAEEDIKSKQKHLEQVTIQLRQQHDEVLGRLNRVQSHADEVKRQENELSLREKALEKKQVIFEEERHSLAELRAELQNAAQSLRKEHSDTKTIVELNRIQERCLYLEFELKEAKNQLATSSVEKTEIGVQVYDMIDAGTSGAQKEPLPDKNADPHEIHYSSENSSCSSFAKLKGKRDGDNQVTLLKRVLCRVQQENSELRAIAAQQRRRIDELTSRAAQLANHIAEQAEVASQPRIHQSLRGSQASQQPPEPPPLPPYLTQHGTQAGYRDEIPPNHHHVHSPFLPSHSPRGQSRDWRRKAPRRSVEHKNLSTSFSSDESPTEEVLREARNRIKKLEEESEAVDRSYRDFRARHALSASLVFAPSEQTLSTSRQENQNLIPTQPSRSPLIRSTSFASPGGSQYRIASAVPYSETASKPTSELMSKFSSPQSQFISAERPSYSPLASNMSSRLTDSALSPFRSSVYGRPSERLKSLFENRPNFMKYSVRDRDYLPTEDKAQILSSDMRGSHASVELSPSSVPYPQQGQESSHCSAPAPSVSNQEEKTKITGSYSPAKEAQEVSEESHFDEVLVPDSVQGKKETNESEKAADIHSGYQEEIQINCDVDYVNIDVKNTKSCESIIPQFNEKHSLVNSLNIDHNVSQTLVPVQPSNVEQSVKRHVASSNLVDQTLNDVSTLSSPALSCGDVGSVKTDVPMGTGEKEEAQPSSPQKALNKLAEPVSELAQASEFLDGQTPRIMENGNSGKANQLLNTSLSSIEISDQHVSAGSEGKQTDEDDDFW